MCAYFGRGFHKLYVIQYLKDKNSDGETWDKILSNGGQWSNFSQLRGPQPVKL